MNGFTYKGYTYTPWLDIEDDNMKIWHDFKTENGTTVTCDWSPYSYMTEEEIKLWIDLDRPERIGYFPLDLQDLNTIRREQLEIITGLCAAFTD